MRIEPVSAPRGLMVRALFLASRWMFGRVLAPFGVLYARMPRFVRPQLGMVRFLESGLSIPPRLRALIEVHVSRVNECSFCGDLHEWAGRRVGIPAALFAEIEEVEASTLLEPREKVALEYAAAVATRSVDDAVFARAREAWGDTAMVELTFVASFTTYLNLMGKALQLPSEGLCAAPERALRSAGEEPAA